MRRLNICIDAHDFTLVGGLERFVSTLANELHSRGHNIFLFTYAPQGAVPQFKINNKIKVIHYFFSGDTAHTATLRKKLFACKPDIFLSPAFANNHLLWLKTLEGSDIPFVFSEHADAFEIIKTWDLKEREAVLGAADCIHLLLPAFLHTIPSIYKEKTYVIPHAVNIKSIPRITHKPLKILSIGRLVPCKQFNLLIDAFALLADKHPNWCLEIWGAGPLQHRLQGQITQKTIKNRVKLCGFTRTPEFQYASSDLVCVPSHDEGFSLVLLEAMSYGLPVVGFNGCKALATLVNNGKTGLLASEMTAKGLAEALATLMESRDLLTKMSKNALEESQKYSPQKVYDQWEQLLYEAASCKGHTALQTCLNGEYDTDPERARHVALLRTLLQRKNVLLQDNQWVRRIVRKYKWLTKFVRSAKKLLARKYNIEGKSC